MIDTSATLAATAQTTPATRALLTCGVVAGPLFVVVALLQSYTRDGFDLKRHPFSLLSLGDLGWIQIANFVIVGLLFTAGAVLGGPIVARVLKTHDWRAVSGGREARSAEDR